MALKRINKVCCWGFVTDPVIAKWILCWNFPNLYPETSRTKSLLFQRRKKRVCCVCNKWMVCPPNGRLVCDERARCRCPPNLRSIETGRSYREIVCWRTTEDKAGQPYNLCCLMSPPFQPIKFTEIYFLQHALWILRELKTCAEWKIVNFPIPKAAPLHNFGAISFTRFSPQRIQKKPICLCEKRIFFTGRK